MIIADTSPLNYLILIEAVEILPVLFQDVAISHAVRQELLAPGTKEKVKKWIENAPRWLKVKAVSKIDENIRLGKGEIETISLAIELSAAAILLDDKAARSSARERNLKVIGTLGVLKLADEHKLVDFTTAVKRLQTTNFRVSQAVLKEVLNRHQH
jgi:predicted nucleic acid-binding protein